MYSQIVFKKIVENFTRDSIESRNTRELTCSRPRLSTPKLFWLCRGGHVPLQRRGLEKTRDKSKRLLPDKNNNFPRTSEKNVRHFRDSLRNWK